MIDIINRGFGWLKIALVIGLLAWFGITGLNAGGGATATVYMGPLVAGLALFLLILLLLCGAICAVGRSSHDEPTEAI